METQLAPAYEKMLPEVVSQIAEDMGQLIGSPVSIQTDAVELQTLADAHPADSTCGVVCGRSLFSRKASGIGGILLEDSVALDLSHVAMMLDPPTDESQFQWDGLVKDAMDEIFNIVVGSWNNACAGDARLSSTVADRAVEHFEAGAEIPEAAGIFPIVARYPMTLNDRVHSIAFFLPLGAVHGRGVPPYSPQERFERFGAGPAGGAEIEAPRGPVQPVVFVDYTGSILEWIRRQSSAGHRAILNQGPPKELLADDSAPPAATVLVGVDAEILSQLGEIPFVEIR
ncbi:MAG: hypothetical protein AAF488_09130 [Planctomycetota bacterium]